MPRNPLTAEERIPDAALKYFTNREGFIDAFIRYLHAPEGEPLRVLMFYGVGGIGKTTLIRKLSGNLRLADKATPPFPKPSLPQARFDFDTLRDPLQAYREVLLRLRSELERDFGIPFPRFDLCLAVLLAQEGGQAPDLVRLNPALNDAFKFATAIISAPLAGLGGFIQREVARSGPLEVWVRRAGGTEEVIDLRRRAAQDDHALPGELIKRFALDLKENLPQRKGHVCRGVIFLDSYERLWAEREADRSTRSRRLDEWVRDLTNSCLHCGVLPVLGGKDRLRWEEEDPEWQEYLDQHLMGGLSAHDAQAFLSKCGIGLAPPERASSLQRAIIQCCGESRMPSASSSHTLYLALCAEIVDNTRRTQGRDPVSATFSGIGPGKEATQLAGRFLKSLGNRPLEIWVEELSLTPRFDEAAALALDSARQHFNGRAAWELLTSFSFVTQQPGGFWKLHGTMREVLHLHVGANETQAVHTFFENHWQHQGQPSLSWFHRWSLDPGGALDEWVVQHQAARGAARITEARRLLSQWTDIALDDNERHALGDELWARTHEVLGIALWQTPVGSLAGALTAAIEHYQSALRIYTEREFPEEWARTQINLGTAYKDLPSGDPEENLQQAIACFENALRVYTESEFPEGWARTQNNLGTAYKDLPTGDPEENLKRAINCYENALHVYTEADLPQDWAWAQHNVGTTYRDLSGGNREERLRKAIEYFHAALRVFNESDLPFYWAGVQHDLGSTLDMLAETTTNRADLVAARDCFAAAERGYTAVEMRDKATEAAAARARVQTQLVEQK